jgi:flagellar biosynthesis protein FliR
MIEVAAPVMVSLLLVTVSLGFIARTVPQVEVLIAGFPLNVGLGLVVTAVTLGGMALFFQKTFEEMLVFLQGLMKVA